jgi:hypothetical protein
MILSGVAAGLVFTAHHSDLPGAELGEAIIGYPSVGFAFLFGLSALHGFDATARCRALHRDHSARR